MSNFNCGDIHSTGTSVRNVIKEINCIFFFHKKMNASTGSTGSTGSQVPQVPRFHRFPGSQVLQVSQVSQVPQVPQAPQVLEVHGLLIHNLVTLSCVNTRSLYVVAREVVLDATYLHVSGNYLE